MKNLLPICFLLLLLTIWSCGQLGKKQSGETPEQPDSVTGYFQKMPPADTMRFEVATDDWAVGDTLPNGLFFGQMETRIMNHVPYFDNSGELIVLAEGRFFLTENIEAYLVNMIQGWYRHKSLFLFDRQKNEFTDRLTVADFFGGDGGQLLTGSYLLDYDDDGDKDIVRREIEHWIIIGDENSRDTLAEDATLLLWQGAGFEEATADSAALVQRLPIQSFW